MTAKLKTVLYKKILRDSAKILSYLNLIDEVIKYCYVFNKIVLILVFLYTMEKQRISLKTIYKQEQIKKFFAPVFSYRTYRSFQRAIIYQNFISRPQSVP